MTYSQSDEAASKYAVFTQERGGAGVSVPAFSGLEECLDRLAAHKRQSRPVSTYRLQFHAGFRFSDALALVPYLHALGVTHCYASPLLRARAGSTHGYDITDHNQLNPEIGSEAELREFAGALRERGMGLILDFVPNHMGVGHGTNPWWMDVLEHGQTSPYADFFDIDWQPLKRELHHRVLLPILGDQYGAELEAGRIRVVFADEKFQVRYFDRVLPIEPQSLPLLYEGALPEGGGDDARELRELLGALGSLPPHHARRAEQVQERRERAPQLTARLAALIGRSPAAREATERALAAINGTPDDARTFDRLHELLERQAYRLALWRVSAEEINFRRFFDINDLVGLRMENPRVFEATHRLLRRLFAEGLVQGIRFDHPDGLFNPPQYFVRVQMLYAASQCCGAEPLPPLGENGIERDVQAVFGQHEWTQNLAPLYALVEKILEPGEELPRDWPVDGTVGYDFTNLLNGLFIQPRSQRAFTNLYNRLTGEPSDIDTVIYESKKVIMETSLSSEVTVLAHMLADICAQDRRARDFTLGALTEAIEETIACFPVYRTYIDERGNLSERDRGYIHEAIVRAKRRNPGLPGPLFDFLRDILLLRINPAAQDYEDRLYFALKFQQLTGPVMAKGLEDTACYTYNRFVSVNEVGGSPKLFGHPPDEFHRGNLLRLEQWPYSMLATSTHDTKRSEDVRARLNVLSEMPRQWGAQVTRWRRLNRTKKRIVADGRAAPDANEEYLLYQTLVGSYPFRLGSAGEREAYIQRVQQYMQKALHEAKRHMSWVNPNPEYVEAVQQFVARLLAPGAHGRPNRFLEELEQFVRTVAFFGAVNSLAQVLLKACCPGVPDIYQGQELFDFSLVDPDNRRPVDFGARAHILRDLERAADDGELAPLCDELLRSYQDGRAKLWTTYRALRFRREHRAFFEAGGYRPLYGTREKEEHVTGFLRAIERRAVVVAVPRFAWTLMRGELRMPLGEAWGNAELGLPPGAPLEFRNVMTGEMVRQTPARSLLCREIFARFPVALLAGV